MAAPSHRPSSFLLPDVHASISLRVHASARLIQQAHRLSQPPVTADNLHETAHGPATGSGGARNNTPHTGSTAAHALSPTTSSCSVLPSSHRGGDSGGGGLTASSRLQPDRLTVADHARFLHLQATAPDLLDQCADPEPADAVDDRRRAEVRALVRAVAMEQRKFTDHCLENALANPVKYTAILPDVQRRLAASFRHAAASTVERFPR